MRFDQRIKRIFVLVGETKEVKI
ncbi:hypothetical protein [Nostoc sp.]